MAAPGADKRKAEAAEKAVDAVTEKAAPAAAPAALPRSGGRKSKDKWKMKEWYNIHAPRTFNETVIGESVASDPALLIGRQTDVTVTDLTGDPSKMHIKLKFRIISVDGHEAKTEFVGHSLTSDYVRRLTRRKTTKTDHIVDIRTADGYIIRIKTMAIAGKRIQSSQEEALRGLLNKFFVNFGKDKKLSGLISAIISGDLAKEAMRECKKIVPLRRIEIRKTEILKRGEAEQESILEAEPEVEEDSASEDIPEEEPETEDEEPADEEVSSDDSAEE